MLITNAALINWEEQNQVQPGHPRPGAWVTHQPRSNMNNGVGAARVESLLRAGIKVCLGTDGFSSTMWEEWKFAYLLMRDRLLFTSDEAEITAKAREQAPGVWERYYQQFS